jgi:hypothetical protein
MNDMFLPQAWERGMLRPYAHGLRLLPDLARSPGRAGIEEPT